jgi:hypothetical protein
MQFGIFRTNAVEMAICNVRNLISKMRATDPYIFHKMPESNETTMIDHFHSMGPLAILARGS